MLEAVKKALKITVSDYDEEIQDLLDAAVLDLQTAGVFCGENPDKLVKRAIITYVMCHFGNATPEEYDRLIASYGEQLGRLQKTTGYTDWGDEY